MGLFKNIKVMKDAMAQGMSGAGPTEEALAALTPEQRAAYDAQMAAVAAAQAEAQQAFQAQQPAQGLGGAAGEHVHGPAAPALSPDQIAQMSAAQLMEWQTQQTKAQVKDLLSNPFGRRKPAAAAEGPTLEGGDREREATAERAARDAARGPYLAPDRQPVAFVRLAARGKTQVEEVTTYLGSSGLADRPDLVYGIYRVPDRISPTNMRSEKSTTVEWDIVHAATQTLPGSAPPAVASFESEETWVARMPGDPSVLDEDLGLAYAAYAGIAPEQTLGIARHLEINNASDGDGDTGLGYTIANVTGVHVFHAAGLGGDTYERMNGNRPLTLEAAAPDGFHIELLNWGAIAEAVHPQRHKRFPIPSPFPYLPSTPQELLQAYLEIVGLRAADCYSAQVTEGRARDIRGSGTKGLFAYSTNVGEEQPCADGKERRRLSGGARIVVVYRDRAEYASGRERWGRYESEVLQASLALQTVRPPVQTLDFIERLPGGIRGLAKTADFFLDDSNDAFEKIPPHRYCWPPQKHR
jgi:hypothetical protein